MKKREKENLEFVRSRFEKAAYDIPVTLSTKAMRKKITEKAQAAPVRRKRRHSMRPYIAAAACLVLVIGAVFAVKGNFFQNTKRIATFQSYDEVQAFAAGLSKPAIPSEMGGGPLQSMIQTVESAGQTASNGQNIYCAYYNAYSDTDRNSVYVFSAEGEDAQLLGKIGGFDDQLDIESLLATENRLIVCLSDPDGVTQIYIYDISDPVSPKKIAVFEQSGNYTNAFLIGNTVYTLSNYLPQKAESIPKSGAQGAAEPVKAENISYFENCRNLNYIVISALDTTNGTAGETKAVLGGMPIVCCMENAMYIAEDGTIYGQDGWVDSQTYSDAGRSSTNIVKLELEGTQVRFANMAEVSGILAKDLISDSNLLFADGEYVTLITTMCDENGVQKTTLTTLDKNLKQLGQSEAFAPGETPRDAAVMGSTVYVSTDGGNLYVVDLSDKTAPKYAGSAQAMEYSGIFAPVDETHFLVLSDIMSAPEGGDLVTLYDISDPIAPKVADQKQLENIYVSSERMIINREKGYFAIPYYTSDEVQRYYGVLTLEIQNEKIVVSNTFLNDNHDAINADMCCILGDYIYNFAIDTSDKGHGELILFANKYE